MDSLHTLFQEMGTVDDLEFFAEDGHYKVTFTRNQTNYQIDDPTMDGLIARLDGYLMPEIGSTDLTLVEIDTDIKATECSFHALVDPNTMEITWTRTKKVVLKGI